MEMRKKTVAMTLTPSGEIVDNYEKCKGLRLMDDAMIVYHLIRAPEVLPVITEKTPYKCPLSDIGYWIPKKKSEIMVHYGEPEILTISAQNLGEVDDVAYFKNKMLQGLGIPKEIHPCL
jgi:hypothetical protein